MNVFYVGLVKKGHVNSKILVSSPTGRFYIWTASNEEVDKFRIGCSGEVPNGSLVLANERQINIGRGNLWVPNASQVMVKVEFYGIVSGGQLNKRVLVKRLDEQGWFTVVLPFSVAETANKGDILNVDMRALSPARDDHIAAAFGRGTLQRVKGYKHERKEVPLL